MNFNNSITLLHKSLDLTWQKQKLTAENIANVSTPGYKAKYVSFEDELKKNIESKANGSKNRRKDILSAIESTNPRVHQSPSETGRLDENNVDIDAENIELARAQIQYEYLTRQMTGQLSMLESAIDGRG